MRNFLYLRPKTVNETLSLLWKHGMKAAILAGGTDLMVDLKKGVKSPSCMMDIKEIDSLRGVVSVPDGSVRIGPLETMHSLGSSPVFSGGLGLLSQAASQVGSAQIRNRATLGGNLCKASPSGDTLPALLCLDALLGLEGMQGSRRLPIQDFFRGPGMPALDVGEVLTDIWIPAPPPDSFGVYKKLGMRKAMDLAVVGVAVFGCWDASGDRIRDIRIALGAVAPTPIRARAAEKILTGAKPTNDRIEEAAAAAVSEAAPLSDVRSSEGYRREMIGCLVVEAVQEMLSCHPLLPRV